ncbi:MAG: ArdC family protein [Planctomycetaceae bacterium]|nr:ArdC family protein [Planctomycetaceae bacterium]
MSNQFEIRHQITDQIVEALTNGNLPPWRKPWSDDPNAPGLHISLSSGDAFRGINQLILQLSASRKNFQSKWWGTFNQVRNSGASVRKGQKATKIVLRKPVSRKRANQQARKSKTHSSSCGSSASSTLSRPPASMSSELASPDRTWTPVNGTSTLTKSSTPPMPTSGLVAMKRFTDPGMTSSNVRTGISSIHQSCTMKRSFMI